MLLQNTLTAFEELRAEAGHYGFAPKIESGYRSFERQLAIWNGKAKGERKLLDKNGFLLNRAELSDSECMRAILLWSALPGTSRHEWGTDIDVIDAAAVPADYEVELTRQEADGVFGKFNSWLDERIASGNSFGFRRVFAGEIGGVQAERWHLSYAPESSKIEQKFNIDDLTQKLKNSEVLLLPQILDNLEWILDNFVRCYFEKQI